MGTATLYVASSNHQALRLYQKYGFKVISEFKTTYNGKAVLAKKWKNHQFTANQYISVGISLAEMPLQNPHMQRER